MPDTDHNPESVRCVPQELWRLWEAEHHRGVKELTADHLDRRRRGISHPVVDFLFTYYRVSVGRISRWHPGPGLLLEDAHLTDRVQWRHYRHISVGGRHGLVVDASSVRHRCGGQLDRAQAVVAATLSRPGVTDCFGLHEWAMLYRTGHDEIRHREVPLRVDHDRIDRVVEARGVNCTHYDAFRFFTHQARPLNHRALNRDSQLSCEQPACLHAGMDIYLWAAGMEAGAPGELVLAALRAAFEAREIDMRSSPYDLTTWGLSPIPVETAAGRAEFVAFQRRWMRSSNLLRQRLLEAIRTVNNWATVPLGASHTAEAPQVRSATSTMTRESSG